MNKNWGKLIRGIVCVVTLIILQGQDVGVASELKYQPLLESTEFMPGEVLVSFKPEVNLVVTENNIILRTSPNVVMSMLERLGIQKAELLIKPSRILDYNLPESLRNLYKLTFPVDMNVLEIVDSLSLLPQVLFVEPNYVYHLTDIPPNDTYYSYQWGLHGRESVNVEGAWRITTGDSDIKIAILDSGIDMEHPDLQSKIVDAYDFIDRDSYPEDNAGHGTHVAGIAAALADNNEELNGESYIAGVSWGSPIVPLKVCYVVKNGPLPDTNNCPADKIIEGIYRAVGTEGVRVINISLSGRSSSQNLHTALNYAYVKGVTVVAASGNESSSGPRYPAAYSSAIAVAATNREGTRAEFSNYGPHIDIAAPGVDIISTCPHNLTGQHGYYTLSGTSMATPFVSGVVALVYSVLPESYQRPYVVERILEATATDLGPSGWDQEVGWGRLNAYRAVYEAANPPRLNFYAPLYYSDGADHSAWMTLRVRDTETQKLLYEAHIAQNSDGRPSVLPQLWGIPTGDYDVIIKGPASVTKLVSHVHLTAGGTTYVDFTEDGKALYFTRGGDFNKDDRINAQDFVYLSSVYFTDDWLADLNGDGIVNARDMVAVLNNWFDLGDDYANTHDDVVNRVNSSHISAGNASLSVVPSSSTYDVGQEFEARVQIDTAGKNVKGADLILRYDPFALEVVEVVPGSVFPSTAKAENIVEMGEIIIGAESTDSSFSGTGTVATVRFRVIAGNTPTTVRIQFRPNDTVDSNLVEDGTVQDILGIVGHGRYTLVGTPERSSLNGFFTLPNGDYLTRMENSIAFNPDIASKILVEAATFEAYYDLEWHTLGVDRNILNGLSTYWHTEMITDQIISLRASILDLNDNTVVFTKDNIFLDRTAPTTILTVPTFLPSGGSFEVLWRGQDNLTGIASYDVQYKDGEKGEWVMWRSTTTLTSASFTGRSGHNYYFRIRARDVAGNETTFSREYLVLGEPLKIYLPIVVRN